MAICLSTVVLTRTSMVGCTASDRAIGAEAVVAAAGAGREAVADGGNHPGAAAVVASVLPRSWDCWRSSRSITAFAALFWSTKSTHRLTKSSNCRAKAKPRSLARYPATKFFPTISSEMRPAPNAGSSDDRPKAACRRRGRRACCNANRSAAAVIASQNEIVVNRQNTAAPKTFALCACAQAAHNLCPTFWRPTGRQNSTGYSEQG